MKWVSVSAVAEAVSSQSPGPPQFERGTPPVCLCVSVAKSVRICPDRQAHVLKIWPGSTHVRTHAHTPLQLSGLGDSKKQDEAVNRASVDRTHALTLAVC